MELRDGSVRTEETRLVMEVVDMKIPNTRRLASVQCSTWCSAEVQRLPMRHANGSKTSEPPNQSRGNELTPERSRVKLIRVRRWIRVHELDAIALHKRFGKVVV